VSLKRHTLYNLLGSLLPMLISMVAVPIYLRILGDARYGVLALVWLFLGYFGLFDPGIVRAAAYHIARLHSPDEARDRESVFWTALVINAAFGIVGGTLLYFAARPVFMTAFTMPDEMRREVMTSLPWLAASVPVSVITGVLSGALEAREKFAAFNLINSANSVAAQIIPLLVAYLHGPDLTWLIPAVLIARTAGAIPSCIVLVKAMPLGIGGGFDRSRVKSLFAYGGWITATNLLNPILTTVDRMLIGSLLSAQAVAFYSVPFNLVSRVSIIPGALSTSLFPRLSRGTRSEGDQLASDALAALAAVMTPLLVGLIAVLPIFMRYWVGGEFARQSASVAIVLTIGMWINSLAFIPYGHLQASGRPDLVAKFHAWELVPFLGVLWTGLHFYGLLGAAWAWTFRVTFDGLLLFVVAGKVQGWSRILLGAAFILLAASFSPTLILSFKSAAEIVILLMTMVWAWTLSPIVRRSLRTSLRLPYPQEAAEPQI
jgi:O-antigen/teichoic acid export membrane protein